MPQLIRSNPLTLQVNPLPAQNRPSSFKGQVGSFDMDVSLSVNELDANDATNLKIRIQGIGNVRMVEKPDILFPQNLEVFDPNVVDNIRNNRSGISGSREYDFVIIPRTPGEFTIPSIQFSYYDPSSDSYVNKSSGPLTLNVSGVAGGANEQSQVGRSEFQSLSTDIRFIVTRPFPLMPVGKIFFRSKAFYILLILPFLLFAILLFIGRREIKLRSNAVLMRNKKADKLARKRLKQASVYMDKKEDLMFFDEIFRALWGYLSDKLSIPQSMLNKDEALKAFQHKGISEAVSGEFLKVLNDCEYARFAPAQSGDKMESIYNRAVQSIVRLEKEIRFKRSKTT